MSKIKSVKSPKIRKVKTSKLSITDSTAHDKHLASSTASGTIVFIGRGWIDVPEAKLLPNDEITGWAVKRDLPFFALAANVHIKVESTQRQVNLTHFVVHGTEDSVNQFHKIIKRAVRLHNQQRFPNMTVPRVTWEMKITSKKQINRRRSS